MQNIKNKELNIFKNEIFNGENKIAPKSKGIYKFCVENTAEEDIIYNIKFKDEMDNFVNLKYKLKIDNVYIRGNEENYIKINELNVENIIVLKNSINVFTIEWYWEDDDKNDTYIAKLKDDQYYKLNLEIQAQKYEDE